MKVKISIVILILVSFFNMGAVSDSNMKANSFRNIESAFINKSEFIENGSKIQYKTKNSISNEKIRIEKYILDKCSVNYKNIKTDKIEFFSKDMHIEIDLWTDNNYTYAAITIVNSNTDYKTEELIGILKGLENEDFIEMQCYKYYKGKIAFDKEDKYIKDIFNSIHNVNMISINNGYTGSGYCADGEKINFAISNYNTGTYIIIGTPIIFTTY